MTFTPPLQLPQEAEAALRNYIPGAIQSRLTAKQPDWLAELRRVTVLFINLPDLDHTTSMARVQQVMHALQAALYRFEGSINKLSADDKGASLVAALGLPPLSHEDDAIRGVRAAMAMGAALRDLNVHCAIGVATGQTFCGVVGGQRRREYTMIGDVVNLAARLMQAAPEYSTQDIPILCDEATYRSAQADLDFERLESINVKGKREKINIYQPLKHRQRRPRIRPAQGQKLIGRDAERAVLQRELQALLQDDSGRVVVLEGEAGIGKTRLVEELLFLAQEEGVTCLVGAGDAIEKSTPYYVWREIFNQLFSIEGITDLGVRQAYIKQLAGTYLTEDEQRLIPLLNDVISLDLLENAYTARLSGQLRAGYTRELLVKLLTKARGGNQSTLSVSTNGADAPLAAELPSRRTALVLVLEDAQYMDSASWALALEVCEQVPSLLLVVATRQMGDVQLDEYQQILAQAQYLLLDALSADDALTLSSQRLGVADLPAPVANLITEKAEGHPFFSEQVADSLCDIGVIEVANGQCRLVPGKADLAAIDFPHTVRGIITSRIDRLTPQQQLMVKVASVIGRTFSYQLLHDIYPVDRDRAYLASGLQALARLGITTQQKHEPELTYIFKHISTQEVAYELMLFSQRRQLHQAIAEWYERVHADNLASYYPLLAHHWSQAVGEQPASTPFGFASLGHIQTTVGYLTKAGRQAKRSNAGQEAEALFSRAAQLLRVLPPTPERLEQEAEIAAALGQPVIREKL